MTEEKVEITAKEFYEENYFDKILKREVAVKHPEHKRGYIEQCIPMDGAKFPESEGLYRLTFYADVKGQLLRHTSFVSDDFKLIVKPIPHHIRL